jgi:hypothetical protein
MEALNLFTQTIRQALVGINQSNGGVFWCIELF